MSLICVIMGAESRDVRNESTCTLLDWGFSEYAVYKLDAASCEPIRVIGGERPYCETEHPTFTAVVKRAALSYVTQHTVLPTQITSPVRAGNAIGVMEIRAQGTLLGSVPILSACDVGRITFFQILYRMTAKFLLI